VLSGTVTTSRKRTQLTASGFFSRLNLKSTWFRIKRVALGAPDRVDRGRSIRIRGRVWPRPGARVRLHWRYVGGTRWRVLDARPRVGADGRFQLTRTPRQSVRYRVAVRNAESPVETVVVTAARVKAPSRR
jgi:hypothetical protein